MPSKHLIFFAYRTTIFKQYSGLFNLDRPGDEDARSKRDNPNDTQNIARSWYTTFIVLSGRDITKMDLISELKVRPAFNWLAFLKDEAKKAELQAQKINSKYN